MLVEIVELIEVTKPLLTRTREGLHAFKELPQLRVFRLEVRKEAIHVFLKLSEASPDREVDFRTRCRLIPVNIPHVLGDIVKGRPQILAKVLDAHWEKLRNRASLKGTLIVLPHLSELHLLNILE